MLGPGLITLWATKARITTSRIGNAALLKKRLTRENSAYQGGFARSSRYSSNAAT